MVKKVIERTISIGMGMALGVYILAYGPPFLQQLITSTSELISSMREDRQMKMFPHRSEEN